MECPRLAAWTTAFISAWTVRTQWLSTTRHPTSSQCSSPGIEPLYPVETTLLSMTSTQPQCIRGHVARSEASMASFRKYSSQSGLLLILSPILSYRSEFARLHPPHANHPARIIAFSVDSPDVYKVFLGLFSEIRS